MDLQTTTTDDKKYLKKLINNGTLLGNLSQKKILKILKDCSDTWRRDLTNYGICTTALIKLANSTFSSAVQTVSC